MLPMLMRWGEDDDNILLYISVCNAGGGGALRQRSLQAMPSAWAAFFTNRITHNAYIYIDLYTQSVYNGIIEEEENETVGTIENLEEAWMQVHRTWRKS